jgi:dihydrolipoamide dehydrogenase
MRLIVLGGGPAGYVAALRASQLGAQATLVEAREIGGTCLNRGCIPTKSLVASVERLRQAREAAAFGVEVGEARVDLGALMRRKQEVVAQQRAGVEHLLKARKVDVVAGRGRLIGPRRVRVEPVGDGGVGPAAAAGEPLELEGDALVLASGSQPLRLPIFDFSDPRVFTSDELLEIDHVPESMLVVGGGVIGCEFASVFAALGTQVTIVEMLEQLLPGEDKRTGQTLRQAFRRAGIDLLLKTRVEEVLSSDERGLWVRLSDGQELTAAVALVSVGRQAVSAGLGYEEVGVALERGFVATDDTLRTAADGVFAAGDLAGPPLLAHWAYRQGALAAENAVTGSALAVDRRVVPNCVFSHPEVASCGLSEDRAAVEGIEVDVAHFRFNANAKAVIEGEADGYVRIVSERGTGTVLGASMVGPRVTELIHEIALAATARLTLADVMATIHAHPTLSEAVGEAALSGGGRAMHGL